MTALSESAIERLNRVENLISSMSQRLDVALKILESPASRLRTARLRLVGFRRAAAYLEIGPSSILEDMAQEQPAWFTRDIRYAGVTWETLLSKEFKVAALSFAIVSLTRQLQRISEGEPEAEARR